MNISTKTARAVSILAAICFLIIGLIGAYNSIMSAITGVNFPNINYIMYWIINLVTGVLLLIGKKGIPLVIVLGIAVLINIYYMIRFITVINLLVFVASAVMFIIALFASIPNLGPKAKFTKSIWFTPAILILAVTIIFWIQTGSFSLIKHIWPYMLLRIVEVAGTLLLGLWYCSTRTADTELNRVVNYSASNVIVGSADKIRIYKELLDSGTITQAEFDEKRKQILEL